MSAYLSSAIRAGTLAPGKSARAQQWLCGALRAEPKRCRRFALPPHSKICAFGAAARIVALIFALCSAAHAGEYFDTVFGTSFMLASDQVTCAIHLQTGHVKGFYDNETGQRYVVDSYDTYHLQTENGDEITADERDDKVLEHQVEDGVSVELVCTNAAMPYAKILKRYFFEKVNGQQRIVCRRIEITGKPEQPTLFSSVSTTVFDKDFREDAWYHYVVPQGVVGNQQPVIHASKISRPILRRDHYIEDAGRAACDAWNPTAGAGFAQYLYKVNDFWAYPKALNKQTYWTREGWQIGSGGFFITEEPHSVETRYHLFFEDRLQFHFEFLNLPEHKALRDATVPLPVVRRVLSPGTGDKYLRADSHKIGFFNVQGVPDSEGQYQWGTFAHADDVVFKQMSFKEPGKVLYTTTAKALKEVFTKRREENPHGLYGMYVYRNCISDLARQHADWIRRIDEKRGIVHIRQIPDVADYRAKNIAKESAYLNSGLYYVDGAIDAGGVEWENEYVSQSDIAIYGWRRLYEELHKHGKLLWTNMRTGSMYYDVTYYEGSGAAVAPGKSWRDGADMDLMNKIYQVPGTIHIPLYWWVNGPQENNRRYQNLCLGLALSPRGGAWANKIDDEWPILPDESCFGAAVDEYRDARFTRIGLEPAWWNDLETNVEGYTHRNGDTLLVNVIHHAEDAGDVTVSVDVAKTGFDRDRPVFIWQQQARPALVAGQQYADDVIDKLYVSRTMSKVTAASKLELVLSKMPPNRVRVCTLTQTPAFIFSVDGIATQNLMSKALGCKITGALDEKAHTSTLSIDAGWPIQILAWWPAKWGAAKANTCGRSIESTSMQIGDNDFQLFEIPKGETRLVIASASP
jgi:hypothetical protein